MRERKIRTATYVYIYVYIYVYNPKTQLFLLSDASQCVLGGDLIIQNENTGCKTDTSGELYCRILLPLEKLTRGHLNFEDG